MLSPSMQKWPRHRLLPTLMCLDSHGPGKKHSKGGRDLPNELGGHLSPTFCEWLMGAPLGWTEPVSAWKRSATRASRRRPR